MVTGCSHATVGGIVRGNFFPSAENHERVVYKKDTQVNGLDVMIYFWDERDGAGFCGWWFGPKVGGDQVWAYHPDKTQQMPPQGGWKVPYDGGVDPSFGIQYRPKSQQQGWGQQQQGGWGQQQGGWGQQQQHNQQAQQQRQEELKRQHEQLMAKRAEEQKQKEAQM